MAGYDFYAGIIRFVVRTSARIDPKVASMMECLDSVAAAIETSDRFEVPLDKRDLYARALAGVAGFLQDRILPETIADNNKKAETQIRWAVDTSFASMSILLKLQGLQDPQPLVTIALPPPPDLTDL